jgi:folate-binding protein YgfZ
MDIKGYERVRSGGAGYIEMTRGMIAVWGNEAVQFLDGMITNDVKTLADGDQMLAAFPNAQGRLLAVARILKQGDMFWIETEAETRQQLYENLFRFTFAGDFFVEDRSEGFRFFQVYNFDLEGTARVLQFAALRGPSVTYAVPDDAYVGSARAIGDRETVEINDQLYETLRIEDGIPRYGVDTDNTTIVPELGLDGLISYNKGCYIGQEIIARIHFRGHVAKRLTGLMVRDSTEGDVLPPGVELAANGRNAGKVTSSTYSPTLKKVIALAYVRYEFLAAGTQLAAGDTEVTVNELPLL